MTAPAATLHPAVAAPSTLVRRLCAVGRVLLGLLFVVMGADGFLNYIPKPTTGIPEGAMALGAAFAQSGYMMPLVKGTELVAGLLLLSNRLVPLALVLLAPVVVNIVAFHGFLAPDGLGLAVVIAAVQLALAWAYRGAYRSMLRVRVAPGA